LPVRSFVKTGISVGAHLTGLSRVIATRYRGRGMIFALHSIVDDVAAHPDDSLRCSVSQLEWTLRWLKHQGVEFVSLDEAVERLSAPTTRRFAAFTFDDGYADNLTHALPVMRRFGAPFTVYVTTGMVTRQIDAWWFGLAALVRSQRRIDLPDLGRRFECPDISSKKRTFRAIESAIHNDFGILPHVRAAIGEKKIDCNALVEREALTEQQLRRLAQHPLVTIGGHTTTHTNLAQASAATVEWEMAENRKFLQAKTDTPVEHFAYPFGHRRACGSREAEISRSVGFRTAATTLHGALFPEHAQHLHALPRIHLACDDTHATLRCKADGVYRAIQSRLGSPVARMDDESSELRPGAVEARGLNLQ
jgi:peptidoglycan/xylan/chitin deacetylase (PgdA/CDA1 family)